MNFQKIIYPTSVFIALLWISFCGITAFAQDSDPPITHIVVVSDDNYPPYIFRDAQGKVQGILVDEWKLWEEKTGIKVELVAMDWGRAKAFMQQGKADVIDTIFFTSERAKIYDFTKPYALIDVPVFFDKHISGIASIASLKGFTIGVKSGDACIDVLKKNGITSLKEYNSYKSIIEAAIDHQIKVFSIDKPPALYYLYKNNVETQFKQSLNLYTGKFHRAVKKGRIHLLNTVEQGFAKISKREHEAIEKKWMGEPLIRRDYYRYIFVSVSIFGLIILVLGIFNFALRRKVREKTSELQGMVNELRLSEEKFRAVFEQAATGVSLCDSISGRFIKVNQKYCDIVGYSIQELNQLSFQEISHPEDLQKDLENMNQLFEGRISEFSMEKRYIRKDKTRVWVKITVSPMWRRGDSPSSHLAIVEDITREKRKENLQTAQLNLIDYAQSHSSAQLLQRFLDEAEILTDSEIGFFGFVSEDQKQLTTQTWSTNTLTLDCKTKIEKQHNPFSSAGVWAACVTEKTPVIHNDYENLTQKNGLPKGHLPVIREFVVPVVRSEKIVAVLGVGNKKTEYTDYDVETVHQLADMAWETITRKRAEEEIVRREVFLNAIIENIPNMLFVKDAEDLKFIRLNRAGEELIGRPRHELIGKSDGDFLPKQQAASCAEKDRQALACGQMVDIPEEKLQSRTKGERTLHTKKIPIMDENGSPKYLLGISEDITDHKLLEEQLRQTQKMESIGRLAGGIAHDFNNILSGIFGFSQLAKDHINEPERAQKYVEQIITGAHKARVLVQQILAVSRKTAHKKHPIDISGVVKDALELLRATIPVTIRITDQIKARGVIMADPDQIHQVVMNLCTNAYHAMADAGGTLTVSLDDVEFKEKTILSGWHVNPGRYLELKVADTGHGISDHIVDRIFEPYFTTKEHGKGTGLGLAVVLGIVQEHGGQITVQSRPSKGTVFHVYFPVVEQDEKPRKISAEPVAKPGTEKIMLVDDESDILETCQAILNSHGYRVTVFEDGETALARFKESPLGFDLVITDMTMPGMTGDVLSREILKIRRQMPIIICTGYHESFTQEDALNAGIKRYVQKPVTGTELSNIVRRVLDGG